MTCPVGWVAALRDVLWEEFKKWLTLKKNTKAIKYKE